MDRIAPLAQWLRQAIAGQEWLALVQPYIGRAPDWALLAAPSLVVVLLGWALFRPRGNTEKPPKEGRSQETTAVPSKPAPHAAKVDRAAQTPVAAKTPPVALPTPKPAAERAPRDDDHRAVRVFVSSTFLDMQRERDILVRQIFPALRSRLRTRGVELLEVDLRWGITKEQSESGKTLPTLLAEIDRCRPYFIGLIGDRYGWVPPESALTEELKAAYPNIADAAARSVTELEIIHGVLRHPETADRALFFERDRRWDWMATLNETERAAIAAENDADHAKLAELKASVRAGGARVERYRSPDELGQAVLKALGDALDARFPEAEAPDVFERTARLHRAYARERRGLHIGAAHHCLALDQWMTEQGAQSLLVAGALGGGKSTLIANWLHAWRGAHPSDIVFEHYMAASPDSADPILLMRRLWEHLNRATGETVDLPAGNVDLMEVTGALAQRIAQANVLAERNGANILIALDGLDKLSNEQNLRWMPIVPRVKLLASSLDGEAKSAASSRGWTTLEVKPLAQAERGEFIERTLEGWGRRLLPVQTTAILAHAQAGNPLFLKTVLDELRVSATHARLDERLSVYLGARDMPDLFARVLERLETDCEPGLVAKALPLLWASRAGLEESEIIAISGATPLAWAALRNGLGDRLRDQAGRLAFSHDFLRQAVETRYIASDDQRRAGHLALADHFAKRDADERQAEELPFQLRAAQAWDRLEALLVDLDRFALLCARGHVELLSYWLPLKQQRRDLEALLCGAFEARAPDAAQWTKPVLDLARFVSSFLNFAGGHDEAVQRLAERRVNASERLLGPEHPDTLTSTNDLAETLSARGDFGAAQRLQEHVVDVRTRLLGAEHPGTLLSKANLAGALRASGDLEASQALDESVLAARTRVLGPEHPDTLASMNNLAGTLRARGDLAGAQLLEEHAIEAMTRALGPEHPHTLTTMNNLAATLYARGDLAGARGLQGRVLDTKIRLLGPEHPSTITSHSNIAHALYASGDLAAAQDRYERVLEVGLRVLGPEHPDTLMIMGNLAATLSAQGDRVGAQQLEERVFEARIRLLGPQQPDTLTSANNLAGTLFARGDLGGAQELEERVLVARTGLLGPEHPDTLTSMNNLAGTLFARGDLAGAQALEERVLDARLRLLGPDHPRTLTSMANLAGTLLASGDLVGAQSLHERVHETQTRLLGTDHPKTKKTLESLAAVRNALRQAG